MLRVSVSIAGSVMLIVAASSQTPRPQGPVCPTLADRFGHVEVSQDGRLDGFQIHEIDFSVS